MACTAWRRASRPTGRTCGRWPNASSARPDEAEDAVQETWVRLSRTDTTDVGNLTGWLTTVVSRVCLDMLRSRSARREDPADLPETVTGDTADPEQEAVMADAIGPALLLVLDTLSPAERLAFVLHDMFAVPFPEIAGIIGCSPAAARQLASRGRRRVQGSAADDPTPARRRGGVPWWTPSWPPPAGVTSPRCSNCSIPRWCCGPTPRASSRARPSWSAGRTRSPRRSPAGPRPRSSASSTAHPAWSGW